MITKYGKSIIIGIFTAIWGIGLLIGGNFGIQKAHAQDCSIKNTDIDAITAIQNDPTLSYADELNQELALRKQLVGKTIACAQKETQILRAAIQSTSTAAVAPSLQAKFLGGLDDAANYYSIEQTRLATAGIAGTQAIAKEVLNWRQGTFIPLSENINNYILWAQNQNLFNTAQARMDQTQRAVAFLEIASPSPDLQIAFDHLATSFSIAQTKNAAAQNALSQGLSPDQSLALVKQSLDALSTTYQNFFTVSKLIKGILPQ